MDRRNFIVTGLGAAAAAAMLPGDSVLAAVEPASADRMFIVPDIMWAERVTTVRDEVNNWKTHFYEVMNRWHIVDGKLARIEIAKVGSDRYEQWLREAPPKDGIPPHISFGGCIVAGKGDPTFRPRWEARTRAQYGYGQPMTVPGPTEGAVERGLG